MIIREKTAKNTLKSNNKALEINFFKKNRRIIH